MDNYNNFQNRSYVPREPDFPPREPQVFKQTKEQNTNFKAEVQQQPVNYNVNPPVYQEPANDNVDYYAPVYNSDAQAEPVNPVPQPPEFEQNIGYNQPPQAPQAPQPQMQSAYQQQAYRRPDGRAYQNGYGNSNFDPRYPHTAKSNYDDNAYIYPSTPKNNKKNNNRGLKAFLISLSVVFGICVIGFVALVSYTLGQNYANKNNTEPTQSTSSKIETPTQPTEPAVEHKESDYSEKINANYKGLVLSPAVKDKTNPKYTSEYSYSVVSKSVVGVVGYADKITDVSDCDTQGTGIIISADGYIITNAHIIDNSKTAYALLIVTSENKTYNAGVVAIDTRSDIAVLKADATGLTPATFGKSKDMSIGSTVIAVGNPGGLGYQNSITKGIISAFD